MTWLDAWLRRLEGALDWIGKAALFAMMTAVVIDVAGRYLLNSPAPGVYEITEFYLMIGVVFLGLAATQRGGGHVRVELALERLPEGVQRALEILFLAATLATFAVVAYAAGRASLQNFAFNRWTTGVVQLPTGPSWAIVAAGTAAFCLRLAVQIAQLCLGRTPIREGAPH